MQLCLAASVEQPQHASTQQSSPSLSEDTRAASDHSCIVQDASAHGAALTSPCLLQVREITADVGEGEKRWTLSGILALQEAAEAYLVSSWQNFCVSLPISAARASAAAGEGGKLDVPGVLP